MPNDFLGGVLFWLGWFVARVAVSLAAKIVGEILYQLYPGYKRFIDRLKEKKNSEQTD